MLLQNVPTQATPIQAMSIQELQLRHAIQKVDLQYGAAHDMPVHNMVLSTVSPQVVSQHDMLELEDLMQIDI
ncbi:unnamed protein product [Blepharisma stoltei]|uniref:Uncharacterized protein n=1 Tax=Blepharisma stoltei TaxID=1481888 RepID=A0AAU9IGC1_9CILI|nr:unnamed protein product [Blepharisma stoltei]